jgi:hypothetical protein
LLGGVVGFHVDLILEISSPMVTEIHSRMARWWMDIIISIKNNYLGSIMVTVIKDIF